MYVHTLNFESHGLKVCFYKVKVKENVEITIELGDKITHCDQHQTPYPSTVSFITLLYILGRVLLIPKI